MYYSIAAAAAATGLALTLNTKETECEEDKKWPIYRKDEL